MFNHSFLMFNNAVTRAMSGHGSNVLSLELSQYGLISGSMDTKVKVGEENTHPIPSKCSGFKVITRCLF